MADENKNDSASETLSKGINAAQTISGAIKTGKAVAGMAKGAAAGPYGAIAAGIWENRSKIVPILFAVTAIFLLPVMFVLMLPSIIFGGFDADSPEPDIPVMNDNAAIMSNLHEAETAISTLLQSSHDKVIADINSAVAALADGDLYEIVDPYVNEIMFNSDLLISQYCASKNNYEEINITNLKNTIKKGKDYLFSYKVETISVEVPVETEEKNEEPTVITVTKYTYTVEYAGDSYFADNIFNLTDEQKELAENYAYNLYVFLNDAYIDQSNSVHDSLTDLGGTYPYEWTEGEFHSPFAGMEWTSRITSGYGSRTDPITGADAFHTGIDIAFPKGTEIRAAKSGVVTVSEKKTTGYGYRIVINHGGGYSTLYAHCNELLVSVGDTVEAGDVIAKVGTTGRSTGNHLHFEVIKNGKTQNPLDYIK